MGAYLNRIGTAVPAFDMHDAYLDYARTALGDSRERNVFERLLSRMGIAHRYSVVPADFYAGALPDTADRMRAYERYALPLAANAVDDLGSAHARGTTHLILTSCTGFYAPGVDVQLIERFGLDPGIERTTVGFMGCYAAMSALRLARHIVRSEPHARVLVVNLELCSLHLQRPATIEDAMGFALFADGCAASIVSADATGLELDAFCTTLIPDTAGDIRWSIGGLGFDMRLSLEVPRRIATALRAMPDALSFGQAADADALWAIHPGGRAVIDAVRDALHLEDDAVADSRAVLDDFGNMSSATISFVLERILRRAPSIAGRAGRAVAFGPGMICEAMRFTVAG